MDAASVISELGYIGHNVAAAAHLLSNVDDAVLAETFRLLDERKDSYWRDIAGVEMLRRGMEPGGRLPRDGGDPR